MHIWPGNCHNQISSKCLIARTSKWGEIAGWHSSRVVTKISAAPTADLVPNRTDSLPLCRGLSPFLTPSRPFPLNLACSRSHAHPHCHTPVLSRTPSISRALWLTTTHPLAHLHRSRPDTDSPQRWERQLQEHRRLSAPFQSSRRRGGFRPAWRRHASAPPASPALWRLTWRALPLPATSLQVSKFESYKSTNFEFAPTVKSTSILSQKRKTITKNSFRILFELRCCCSGDFAVS